MTQFKIAKIKQRVGSIEKLVDSNTLLGKDLFSKETPIAPFIGMQIVLSNGKKGIISSSFGKSGKFKIKFEEEVTEEDAKCTISMPFKKLIFDKTHKMVQEK